MLITSCYFRQRISKMNIEIKGGVFAFYVNVTLITPTSGKAFFKKHSCPLSLLTV